MVHVIVSFFTYPRAFDNFIFVPRSIILRTNLSYWREYPEKPIYPVWRGRTRICAR